MPSVSESKSILLAAVIVIAAADSVAACADSMFCMTFSKVEVILFCSVGYYSPHFENHA